MGSHGPVEVKLINEEDVPSSAGTMLALWLGIGLGALFASLVALFMYFQWEVERFRHNHRDSVTTSANDLLKESAEKSLAGTNPNQNAIDAAMKSVVAAGGK